MKAVVYTRYGSPDVLRFTDVEKPAPKDNQVLVKVRAVSLNGSDWEALRGKPLSAQITGPLRPAITSWVGHRRTGRGDRSHRDEIPARRRRVRRHPQLHGGFAEEVGVPGRALAPLPAGMTYEQAAALPRRAPSRSRAGQVQ